jgi:branched-chain amino acid transport system permease protein
MNRILAALTTSPVRTASVAAAAIGVLLPFWVGAYWLSALVWVLIFALGALGLDVLTGRTGQISLGHAFFLSVGAYTGAVLGLTLHLPAIAWLPAGGVVAGIVGGLVAPTALRLKGMYLAIVSIGLVYLGQYIFTNVAYFSGGPGGRSMPVPAFGSLNFANGLSLGPLFINENGLYYYLAFILLAFGMLFVRNLGRTHLGRSMTAVRDGELAGAVLGVNVAKTKITAFIVSSAIAGVAGALYGSYLNFATPGQFDLGLSVQFVAMIIVGGMGSLWGPVLGALFVWGLQSELDTLANSLPFLQGGSHTSGIPVGDAAAIVYGLLLIVFLLVEPRGVVGLGHRLALLGRRRRWLVSAPGVVSSVTSSDR